MEDSVAASSRPWTVYCDGSAVPNPGRMGFGALIIGPDGTRQLLSEASDTRGCNNEAEARALIAALCVLQAQGATALSIYSDSSILVEQLSASEVPPVLRLAAIFEEAGALLKTFSPAKLHWIPRHRNGEADALARAALGLLPKQAAKSSKRPR